jgi:hypothetical protein
MANGSLTKIGYHALNDYNIVSRRGYWTYTQESEFTYTFTNFFHPFVGELLEQLNKESLPGMLDPAFQGSLKADFFTTFYTPHVGDLVKVNYSPKDVDTSEGGPYSIYNWELSFHIPLTVAVHLSKNQRFAEAQRWFHYIFDPTANDTSVPVPGRFWKFLGFRSGGTGKQIDELLAVLSKPAAECTAEELELKAQVLSGYEAIKNKPFQPHAVARTRHLAYMYCVVMKYLDNLIAWGDNLFRQDTLETINEATQLYVLAANILGERPQKVPLKGTVKPKTFAQLKAQGLDAIGNVLVELEGSFPFNLGVPTGTTGAAGSGPLLGIGRTLYFCIPRNDKLLSYWDLVADRLFKIRHCMNIEGVVRPLALFDPPLDPGMLVKAAAAGIDIGSIVAGLNQPVSPLRALASIQKALELCAEVRNLGGALLSAIEKGDGERIAILRQGHEIKIQQMQQEVRFLQWKQSQEATESLLRSRATTLERYRYYLRLLGQTPDAELAPETFALDRRELTEENFDETYAALVEQYDREGPVQVQKALELAGGSPSAAAGATGPGNLALTKHENDEIDHLTTARDYGLAASIVDATGAALAFVPDPKVNFHYWGMGGTADLKVGTAILKGVEIVAKGLQMNAAWEREQAGLASRTASYERRVDDWTLQSNLAARELRQLGRQIVSSLIAEQIARGEYEIIQRQIENSKEIDLFLREKFSNAELYGWMQGELSRLYYEYYRLAFDIARRAEQTMKRELMRPELDSQTLVKFNYWDGGRKGLLSGEALHLDVKRMEMAYHEHNLREYELTKHVSVLQVDPLALVQLRNTGRCTVSLPESLFDLDGPGHYFRRIKSVALSIPCVTGPFAGVNCKLTLLKSTVRTSPLTSGSYEREDGQFQDYFGSIQSVVASSSQQDSGLFETNLRDERYLPFENAGAISDWQIELPSNPSEDEPAQFDYDTITDVILHLRYTARDGGATLRTAALDQFKQLVTDAQAVGSIRLFSVRHEFASAWASFQGQKPGPNQRYGLTLKLLPEHYPFWSQGSLNRIERVDLFARSADDAAPASIKVSDRLSTADSGTLSDSLNKTQSLNDLLVGKLSNVVPPSQPVAELKLFFDNSKISDLWITVTWGG